MEQYNYLTIERHENGITIRLNDDGRELVNERFDSDWYYAISGDLLEDVFANGEWQEIYPEQIGALTEALLLSDNTDRDDQGFITRLGDVYSDINTYQIRFWYELAAEEDGCWFAKA